MLNNEIEEDNRFKKYIPYAELAANVVLDVALCLAPLPIQIPTRILEWGVRTYRASEIAYTVTKASKTAYQVTNVATKKIAAAVNKELICLDKLSKAGQIMDRGGLTRAGKGA